MFLIIVFPVWETENILLLGGLFTNKKLDWLISNNFS